MDPDIILAELRELAEDYRHGAVTEAAIETVIERFEALDGWLSKGGFLPFNWREARSTLTPHERDHFDRHGHHDPSRRAGW